MPAKFFVMFLLVATSMLLAQPPACPAGATLMYFDLSTGAVKALCADVPAAEPVVVAARPGGVSRAMMEADPPAPPATGRTVIDTVTLDVYVATVTTVDPTGIRLGSVVRLPADGGPAEVVAPAVDFAGEISARDGRVVFTAVAKETTCSRGNCAAGAKKLHLMGWDTRARTLATVSVLAGPVLGLTILTP